jgi:hypothetical protein
MSLAACAALPSFSGLDLPEGEEVRAPVAYPNLDQIPSRPPQVTSPQQREEIIESLLADRALTAQAAESLRREIETNFEFPEPPAGS